VPPFPRAAEAFCRYAALLESASTRNELLGSFHRLDVKMPINILQQKP